MSKFVKAKTPSDESISIPVDKIKFLIGNKIETFVGLGSKQDPLHVSQPPDDLKSTIEKIRPGMKRTKNGPWIFDESDIKFINSLVDGWWLVEYPDGRQHWFELKKADIGPYDTYSVSFEEPPKEEKDKKK